MSQKAADNIINLHGGSVYITEHEKSTYLLERGTLLVYILPLLEDGGLGRRLLLYEAAPGEIIPSFHKEVYGTTWVFCMVALDFAEIKELPDTATEESFNEFVKRTGLKNRGEENYVDLLLEVYDRNSIKEEGYIYSNQKEKEIVKDKSLRLIYDLFDNASVRQSTAECGNTLYDAVAYVCDRSHIKIAPVDKVTASTGRRFMIEDIARVSNFIVREVALENGWLKKDSGPMVGFFKEGHKAVALLPNGRGRYIAWNPENHTKTKVDAKFESKLELKAYALYPPFPNKKMTIMEMFRFGFRETNISDWVQFCLLTLLGTFIGILLPMLNQQIYDNYIPMGDNNGIIQLCAALLACNLGNLSFTIVKNLSALRGVSKMRNAVLAALCERVFNLPESFYRGYKPAELSDRILKIDQVFSLLSQVGLKTLISAVFSLLYLTQMHKASPELMKFAIIFVSAILILMVVLAVLQVKYEKELLENSTEANSRMYQYLSGIQKIRASGVEDRALLEYLNPYGKAKKITMRKERITNIAGMITSGAGSVFTVIMYYQMVNKEMQLSVGEFSAFMAAFGAFMAAIMEVGTSLFKLNGVIPMLDRLKPILETLPEYEEEAELPGELSGEIEISNVDFAYDKDGPNVLSNLSVHIRAGEYIGIVGSSGCGKSTLLKLLLGFEKPVSGKIYYDSKDIDRMDKRELRKKFGVVLQEGRLIAGSIFDNITIAAPGATLKDAERVAEQVGLAEDIARMPMGMHTVLSETGGTISGGQQQRILIARAIIGKPKIIFFDEATSALDNVTQAMVCESLNKLDSTRLVIAHRLSTIMDCDRILVMDKGEIVEEGNFEALMEKKGIFYELASRQMA